MELLQSCTKPSKYIMFSQNPMVQAMGELDS